jgi:tRNA A-37 threonylcarbamoyl transferase component Bud32
MNRNASARLAQRVELFCGPVTHYLMRNPNALLDQIVVDLLQAIEVHLDGLKHKWRITQLVQHQEITNHFMQLNEQLNQLTGHMAMIQGVHFLPVDSSPRDATAEDNCDKVEDFTQMQQNNLEMIPDDQVEEINRGLQLGAPFDFKGFIEIDYNLIKKDLVLHKGSSDTIYRAKLEGLDVAVKEFNRAATTAQTVENMRRELREHSRPHVSHQGIVKLHGACTVQPHFALVMEYAPFGSLHDLLHLPDTQFRISQELNLRVRIQILQDFATAIRHLHGRSIYHGDVTTSNMLVFDDHRVKLCDFGLSKRHSSQSPASGRARHSDGTEGLQAPEICDNTTAAYTYKTDVFGYGTVMYEIITGTMLKGQQQQKSGTEHGCMITSL